MKLRPMIFMPDPIGRGIDRKEAEQIREAEKEYRQFSTAQKLVSKAHRKIIRAYGLGQRRAYRRNRRFCANCGHHRNEHAKGKCLFASTTYAPWDPTKYMASGGTPIGG